MKQPHVMLSLVAAAVLAATSAAPAWAAIPSSLSFNPAQADYQTNKGITLSEATAAQSFGYDDPANMLYTAQIAQTAAADDAEGNLTITRVDNDDTSRKWTGMLLKGFGHGVSIGVQPNPDSTGNPRNAYLWVECKSPKPSSSDDSARGTKLCRLSFHAGWTVTYNRTSDTFTAKDSSGDAAAITVDVYDPVADADTYTANVDMSSGRIIVRYSVDGAFRFRVYSITDMRARNYSAYLADRAMPTMSALAAFYPTGSQATIKDQPFQGYAMYGSWVYLLHGKGGKSSHTFISAMDLNTGALKSALTPIDERSVASAVGFSDWEGEGMAIRTLPDGGIRLRWGLALGASGNTKKLAIVEKRVLS